jgi:hypothetical protein
MERTHTGLLLALGACGALMILLSALPWITFTSIDYADGLDFVTLPDTSISISGLETSRLRDTETIDRGTIQEVDEWCSCRVGFGDGYLVAGLGLGIIAAAAIGYLSWRLRFAGMAAMAFATIALFIAGYNALGDWGAFAWTPERQTEVLEGEITPFLWALVAVSAAAAVLGGVLWSLAPAEIEEPEFEWDDQDLEDESMGTLNAWT